MIWLIGYDIRDNKLRKKIADILLQFGCQRIQLSIFIGYVLPNHFANMHQKINTIYQLHREAKDSVFFIKITVNQLQNMLSLGINKVDVSYLDGQENTLYF